MCNEPGSRERKTGVGGERAKEERKADASCVATIGLRSPESLGGPLAWPPDIQPREPLSLPLAPLSFLPPQVVSTCGVYTAYTNVRDAPREPIAPCTLAAPRDDALCAIYVNCWTRALVTPARFSSLRARGIDYIGYKTYWDR